MTETEKDNALREVRKLIDILQKYGNVLVPSLGFKETSAKTRLAHFVKLLTDTGMSVDTIQSEVDNLDIGHRGIKFMEWKEFDRSTCPQNVKLLFLEKSGKWYEGEYNDYATSLDTLDPEKGYCISTFETYAHVDNITHYLEVVLPS